MRSISHKGTRMVKDGKIRHELQTTDLDKFRLNSGADPGFLLGGGAPLRNDVTIQDFSRRGCTSKE